MAQDTVYYFLVGPLSGHADSSATCHATWQLGQQSHRASMFANEVSKAEPPLSTRVNSLGNRPAGRMNLMDLSGQILA